MKKKINVLTLCAMLLALCSSAQAQQPTKVPRIGYLSPTSPSVSPARIEAFRQGLRELGYVEGKNIVIEYRYAEGKFDRLPALAAELVRLKVDLIVTSWSDSNPCGQGSDDHNSHCHGDMIPILLAMGSSPALRGLAATLLDCPALAPGAKRKATGASEGDRSKALPRGRLRDFNQPGQRTSVKRDGARRRGVRSEASIPRRARSQGY